MGVLKWIVFTLGLLVASVASVASAEDSPEPLVREINARMMLLIKDHRALYAVDSQALYDALDELLSPVVAFDAIANSVMSVKYNRQASDEQMQQFVLVFKKSLVEFYGKALGQLDDDQFNIEIEVRPVESKLLKKRRVPVKMDVTTTSGTVIPLTFTTFRDTSGAWKLRNVIINGINIGKLFRTQFDQAMQDNGKDLQYVIDNWVEILDRSNEKHIKS